MKRILLIFSSLFIFVIFMYISLCVYISANAEKTTAVKSDAILVLGAQSYIDGKYNPCLEARVSEAVSLYKDGYASKIIVSGGNDSEDNASEAETMRKIAMEKRVPSDDILLEKEATSTYENFVLSQKIMKQNGMDSIIIVTEPFHMPRASLVAQKLGMNYTVAPATESSCWQ